MTPRAATDLSIRVLLWLAEDPDRTAGFLAATGLDPATLRARIAEPGLQLAILDHLMGDEGLLLAACQALDLTPDSPARAQVALGGGPAPHWT